MRFSYNHRQKSWDTYSYFEKGCRKKCTRQSRKALWVVSVHCSSEKFERIGTKGQENVFASANGKQQKLGSTATVVRNSVSIISHITFRDCRVHIFSDNLSRDSCIHFWSVSQFKQAQPLPSPHKQSWTRVSRICFEFQFCIR